MPARLPRLAVNLALRLAVKPALMRERSPRAMRARLERTARQIFRMPPGVTETPGEIGGVPVLWLTPRKAGAGVIHYLHGGAYLAGSPQTHKHLAARLAIAAGARAVLPDYRLAPEHPFPAALEDALAVHRALLVEHEPKRVALAGDSAGGGLAAATLLAAETEGFPAPAALVAFSPWADLTGRAESLRTNRRRDAMLPAERLADVVDLVLQGADAEDPRASPAFGRCLSPPPAWIVASRDEILVDDARALARALGATLTLRSGLPHAWPVLAGILRAADRTVIEAGRFLAAHLG